MKTKILITLAALVLGAGYSQAQTNNPTFTDGLQIMAQSVASATNWTVLGGVGQSLKGQNRIGFGAVAYNFNQNVGIVAGVDTLWQMHGNAAQQQNVLKGGVTLSAPIHPLAFIGSTFLTNVVATPFAAELMASPTGGSSDSVATITAAGLNFDIVSIKNFELVAGAEYETRTGSGVYNGNYGLIHLGLSRRF